MFTPLLPATIAAVDAEYYQYYLEIGGHLTTYLAGFSDASRAAWFTDQLYVVSAVVADPEVDADGRRAALVWAATMALAYAEVVGS